MKRDILRQLKNWKKSPKRKPLILKGARQVGKTYIIDVFGKECFDGKYYYIDLKERKDLHSIFSENTDPNEIMRLLQFKLKTKINYSTDLLVLDEIQECPGAIINLKYFERDMPDLALISAGSHLGLTKNEESFPVGKVDFLYMFPMTFSEFLCAVDSVAYEEYNLIKIENDKPVSTVIHETLLKYLKYYFAIGGLPEVVQSFIDGFAESELEALESARTIQKNLIEGYKSDFAKYSGTINVNHIHHVFESAPMQLSKSHDEEVRKYQFQGVVPKQKGFERIRSPLGWLVNARLCIKSLIANRAEHPLMGYCNENRFKLFLFDVGLLNAMLNTPPEAIVGDELGSYKGFIAENFVSQELFALTNHELISWKERGSEIEFLIVNGKEIIPVEVKSSKKSRRSKSLYAYIERYHPKQAFKLSAQNIGHVADKNMTTLPLYCVSKIM